jgi:hypothetical protein
LEYRRRRRRQARRRRDATLGPEDVRAVRQAVSCSRRQSCFLQPRHQNIRCFSSSLAYMYKMF